MKKSYTPALGLVVSVIVGFIIGIILLISARSVRAEELPLYPEDSQHALMVYEIGVESKVIIDTNIELTFKNTYMEDGNILTEGEFVVSPKHEVIVIKVEYVLVNKDKQIIKVLSVISKVNGKNVIEFSRTYPYSPDYEYCVFHVRLLQKVRGGTLHVISTFS